MPHSGGGGSHGGGSHHSSHSSHSSSGGGSSRRVGTTYFSGATKYVYYVNKKPTYIYSNYDIRQKNPSPLWTELLVLAIFFSVPLFIAIACIEHPKKLVSSYADGPQVIDTINAIDNEDMVIDKMQEFYEITGITPVVMTVYNETWDVNYTSMMNYAFDEYLNMFPDEKQMLIVYSEAKNPDPSFLDWNWELMVGDDTNLILTDRKCDKFTDNFQKELLVNSIPMDQALVDSFDFIMPGIMRTRFPVEMLCFISVWETFVIFMIYISVSSRYGKKAKAYQKAIVCPEMVVEDNCEYCTGVYVVGLSSSCPHCGAPLPAHTYPTNQPGKTGL